MLVYLVSSLCLFADIPDEVDESSAADGETSETPSNERVSQAIADTADIDSDVESSSAISTCDPEPSSVTSTKVQKRSHQRPSKFLTGATQGKANTTDSYDIDERSGSAINRCVPEPSSETSTEVQKRVRQSPSKSKTKISQRKTNTADVDRHEGSSSTINRCDPEPSSAISTKLQKRSHRRPSKFLKEASQGKTNTTDSCDIDETSSSGFNRCEPEQSSSVAGKKVRKRVHKSHSKSHKPSFRYQKRKHNSDYEPSDDDVDLMESVGKTVRRRCVVKVKWTEEELTILNSLIADHSTVPGWQIIDEARQRFIILRKRTRECIKARLVHLVNTGR